MFRILLALLYSRKTYFPFLPCLCRQPDSNVTAHVLVLLVQAVGARVTLTVASSLADATTLYTGCNDTQVMGFRCPTSVAFAGPLGRTRSLPTPLSLPGLTPLLRSSSACSSRASRSITCARARESEREREREIERAKTCDDVHDAVSSSHLLVGCGAMGLPEHRDQVS